MAIRAQAGMTVDKGTVTNLRTDLRHDDGSQATLDSERQYGLFSNGPSRCWLMTRLMADPVPSWDSEVRQDVLPYTWTFFRVETDESYFLGSDGPVSVSVTNAQ